MYSPKQSSFRRSMISVVATCLALAGPCYAVTPVWTSSVGGDFLDAGNWNLGVPDVADSANFNNELTGTVEFSASHVTQDLFMRNTSGTIIALCSPS